MSEEARVVVKNICNKLIPHVMTESLKAFKEMKARDSDTLFSIVTNVLSNLSANVINNFLYIPFNNNLQDSSNSKPIKTLDQEGLNELIRVRNQMIKNMIENVLDITKAFEDDFKKEISTGKANDN